MFIFEDPALPARYTSTRINDMFEKANNVATHASTVPCDGNPYAELNGTRFVAESHIWLEEVNV